MRRTALRTLLAALVLAAVLPARAALFYDDEALKADIGKLRSDIAELQQKAEILSRSQLDFANQLDPLKADIARLRGQVEVITYDLDAAQKRQKDFYVDLDNRLRKLEQQAALAAEQQKAAAAVPAVDPAAEMRDYETALTAFKGAKYKDAAAAFQGFIKTYPKSTLLPSAHYWQGASLRQLRDCKEAAGLFGLVAEQWPDDAKAADALLAKADCQQETGDGKGARKTLETLVAKYPGSSPAQTAKQRLKKR